MSRPLKPIEVACLLAIGPVEVDADGGESGTSIAGIQAAAGTPCVYDALGDLFQMGYVDYAVTAKGAPRGNQLKLTDQGQRLAEQHRNGEAPVGREDSVTGESLEGLPAMPEQRTPRPKAAGTAKPKPKAKARTVVPVPDDEPAA